MARSEATMQADREHRFIAIEKAAEAMCLSLSEFEERLHKPGDFYQAQREEYENLVDAQVEFLLDDRD